MGKKFTDKERMDFLEENFCEVHYDAEGGGEDFIVDPRELSCGDWCKSIRKAIDSCISYNTRSKKGGN